MKIIALALCTTFMFCALAVGQQPTPTSPPKAVQSVSENYVMELTISDKGQKTAELSLVVASAEFNTSFPDTDSTLTTFAGKLIPEDSDTVSIRYALGGHIATQTTVHLKLGEPVQILKSDTRICTLRVSRLSDQRTQGK